MAPSKTASASATATPAPASAPAQAPAPVPAPATTSKPRPKQTKMPTPQEMQELYDRITPLQKIVTLQHIYSLYMAAAQSPSPKKDVSFNIIQLQRMINSNPLVNPDFDFLNVKNTSNATAHTGAVAGKGPVSPVQLIQILTESLTLGDTSNGGGGNGNGNGSGGSNGKNEQVIQQVPNTMLFKLSRFIDLNFVKDRLIKLLNAYKNTTCKEIEDLQTRWKTKQDEITKIEQGKMDDSVLYEEFLRDLKRKRGVVDKRDKSSTPTPTGTPTGAATAASTPPTVAVATAPTKGSATGNTTESKEVFVDAAESPETGTGTGTGTGAESKTKPNPNPKLTPSKPEPIAHKTRSSSKHKLDESSEPNEPTEEAPSPKRAKLRTRSHDASTGFQTQALRALSILSSNPLAEPILQMPVTIAEYKRVVKRPRDLQSITRGVEAGDIADRDTLMYDVQLAFANAAMYSGADVREAVQAWDGVAESLP